MNKNTGFTLIELMIVVAIIGIIGAIAYPSYDSFMKKSRRTDARTALTTMVDRQERIYLQDYIYTTKLADVGGAGTDENFYALTINAAGVNGFTITATAVPGGPQAGDTTTDDGDCTVLTITSTGVKTPAACW